MNSNQPNILDPNFKYTNAAESSEPGYLKAKFDKIRAALREVELAKQQNNVAVIRRRRKP